MDGAIRNEDLTPVPFNAGNPQIETVSGTVLRTYFLPVDHFHRNFSTQSVRCIWARPKIFVYRKLRNVPAEEDRGTTGDDWFGIEHDYPLFEAAELAAPAPHDRSPLVALLCVPARFVPTDVITLLVPYSPKVLYSEQLRPFVLSAVKLEQLSSSLSLSPFLLFPLWLTAAIILSR